MANVPWSPQVKFIISDVDETIADNFLPVVPEMADELNTLLQEGKSLFLVSGAGFSRIKKRVVNFIRPELRKKILVSHCSGAEVRGFDEAGHDLEKPYYTMYDQVLSQEQKARWREIVKQVIDEFHLQPYEPLPVKEFKETYGDNPLVVMLEDRGPQITFEFVNAYNLTTEQIEKLRNRFPNFDMSDLRIPVMERIQQLFSDANIPVTPRIAGVFALDLALKGVSKTTSVKFVLENEEVLFHVGLTRDTIHNPEAVEIWGDKFSVINGGTDRHMSEALPKEVRSIDFRHENPEEFMEGYTTVLWDGEKQLHEGLLEYLQMRHGV
jgi:hydroxymethylpyrimidine pyrophosphatase-like HAD family hydrolase